MGQFHHISAQTQRISKFYRYVNICSQCQLSLFVASAMKRSKLQPHLKCFPLVRLGRGRDPAFFLFLERPPPTNLPTGLRHLSHRDSLWQLGCPAPSHHASFSASGKQDADSRPRERAPLTRRSVAAAGPHRPGSASYHGRYSRTRLGWRVPSTSQAHLLAAVNKGGRPESPPLPSFPHGCQSVTLPHAALLSSENRTGFWYIFFSKG